MPQHKSAIKRVRQSLTRRLRNRDQRSQMRTYIKKVLISTDKTEAESHLKVAVSYLDKMGRKGIVHKNQADNKKSRLVKHVNKLS